MKRILLSIVFLIAIINLQGQCVYPNQTTVIESDNLRANFSNTGDLWGPKDSSLNSFAGIEYPKLTKEQIQQGEIAKTCMFSGNFLMSANIQGFLKVTRTTLRSSLSAKLLSPGPISLKTGQTSNVSANTFNKIWSVSIDDITKFQNQIINSTLPLNTSSIPNNILTWPAIGNLYYKNSAPIEETLAPFNDINKNGIYDPENGDFPKIKGDISYFTVMNDNCDSKGIGLELHLFAYIVNSEISKNSIFYDLEIIKKTKLDADNFIFGVNIDPDLGNPNDDLVGCDSFHNIGYCYNGDSFDEDFANTKGYKTNFPLSTFKFLNSKMSSFIPLIDANDFNLFFDYDYRNIMTGLRVNGSSYFWGKNGKTGTTPTKFLFTGDPSKSNEWSMYSENISKKDSKFYMNTEPIKLVYNTPQLYSFKASVFSSSTWPPRIKDSIIPQDELIVKVYDSINSCPLSISNVKITPDVNNQSNGSIEFTINSRYTPVSKWSSGEKNSPKIINKKAGNYSIKIYDGNCILDTSFTITTKSSAGILSISSKDFKIYPIPAKNELNIDFNRSQLINSITIQNIEGQVIRVKPIKSAISTYTLSIQDLPKGVYFLQVDGQDLNQVSKFTKE